MRLLVTGGAGFIGSHLVDYFLKKGYRLLVFDNLSSGKKDFFSHNLTNPQYSFVKLNLTNFNELQKNIPSDIDTIFHLAANSNVMHGIKDPDIDFNNSTLTTFNILKVMKEKKIKKIFYFSGSGVYGDSGKKKVKENYGPLFPVSYYGATKLSAEALIYAFAYLYNFQAWILRPANIIGPRVTHGVVFDFFHQLKKNPHKLRILGNGKQSKSYLYITDVLEAVDLVWRRAKKPINLFNISSTNFIEVDEIAQIIISEMGLSDVVIKKTGGREGGWRGDVPVIKLDSQQLFNLSWKPKYNCREAVQKTVRHLLSTYG